MEDIRQLKSRLDSHDVHGMIASMPAHLEDGLAIGHSIDLDDLEEESFHSIVVSGMGGSAIAGDIVRSYLMDDIEIPFTVCRHYRLPGFVNWKSLVICSSYSGNTEETLHAYDCALDRGARVVAITTGGKLGEKADVDRVPLVKVKEGLPPRAALGYSFAPLLTIISRLGLCEPRDEEVRMAMGTMKQRVQDYSPDNENNPALRLSREIFNTIPVIYSGYERLDAAATRFKGQINENAEWPAFTNVFPEFNHNELVGWHKMHGLESRFTLIVLKDEQDHPRIRARMDIVDEYLRERGMKVLTLESEGGSALERIFYFIQLADFTSYYLALLNGVDPYPVKAIDYLKKRLSEID